MIKNQKKFFIKRSDILESNECVSDDNNHHRESKNHELLYYSYS